MDQRGCGRSTPWAIDDLDRLDSNTTATLIADIEALRTHLGIDRCLVHGVSWGSTLALAYALAHPARVTELVLTAVTTGSREEIDWITEGVGRVFPEAWERFSATTPVGDRVVEHYARELRDADLAVRSAAADAWDAWESTHISLDPSWRPGALHDDLRERASFATLVTHYWAHDCFLPGSTSVLARAHELAGIPGVLVHGRRDISGPGDHTVEAAHGVAGQRAARRRVGRPRRPDGDGARLSGDRRVRGSVSCARKQRRTDRAQALEDSGSWTRRTALHQPVSAAAFGPVRRVPTAGATCLRDLV